jgi:hypothetical protein
MSGWSLSTPAPVLTSLDLQMRLFRLALSDLGGEVAWNEVLEIRVDADRTVTIERFDLPEWCAIRPVLQCRPSRRKAPS